MRRKRHIAPRLTVYGVSAAEWTMRYGIEPFSSPCGDCGRILTTSLPFVEGVLRGLRAPACECGQDQAPYVLLLEPIGLASLGP